ncbi:o-succinylbenzoate--CoA ligase [Aureibacillus halotolerans]|uniref:2-succinylbenzoate--CoA ligase n=1 Tax=Aureibacillus halotolerans TaxID=1508390 RepID=A0A4R6U4A1_9BACI|nr:o-succinylbenzoate--CoA ligase [Aureibacillus halotolerans]TDQ40302.1 2-succinylbenzoyl-CoA synthetase [Aureibacillus halotolerans]
MEIPSFLPKRAALTPASLALVTETVSWTFKTLHDRAAKIASALHVLREGKGTRVACLVENVPETVPFIHACQYTETVAVLLNTRLSERELQWQINEANCCMIVYTEGLADVAIRISKAIKLEAKCIDQLANEEDASSFFSPRAIDLKTPATIMFTSGTTGSPKGVLLTWRNHYFSAINASFQAPLSSAHTWLTSLPLYHVSGFSSLIKSALFGNAIYLSKRFDSEAVWRLIQTKEISHISVVTKMLSDLLSHSEGEKVPSSLLHVLLGGGPVSASVLQKAEKLGWPISVSYGLTETASQAVSSAIADGPPQGSSGKAMSMNELYILNNDGKEASVLEPGEIFIKGPTVTEGYINSSVVIDNRFGFPTGDIGYLDEKQFLFVLDRRSDLLISGGENVYPAEIEHVLEDHPDVVSCGVTKKSDDKWGEVPVAYIVFLEGKTVRSSKLRDWCGLSLATYKIPKEFREIKDLPRNSTGKLQRHRLVGLPSKELED